MISGPWVLLFLERLLRV